MSKNILIILLSSLSICYCAKNSKQNASETFAKDTTDSSYVETFKKQSSFFQRKNKNKSFIILDSLVNLNNTSTSLIFIVKNSDCSNCLELGEKFMASMDAKIDKYVYVIGNGLYIK